MKSIRFEHLKLDVYRWLLSIIRMYMVWNYRRCERWEYQRRVRENRSIDLALTRVKTMADEEQERIVLANKELENTYALIGKIDADIDSLVYMPRRRDWVDSTVEGYYRMVMWSHHNGTTIGFGLLFAWLFGMALWMAWHMGTWLK